MRIHKENSICLIIDVQERLIPHIFSNEIMEKNLGILVCGMKILEIPLIITEQYSKGLGKTISSLEDILTGNQVIEKMAFSCCDEIEFMKLFKDYNKKDVIIAGIEAHVCVLQTVLDLLELGFKPFVIEDCIASRKLEDKEIALERMQKEGAVISTFESILFELTRVSGTQQFKSISKLVK